MTKTNWRKYDQGDIVRLNINIDRRDKAALESWCEASQCGNMTDAVMQSLRPFMEVVHDQDGKTLRLMKLYAQAYNDSEGIENTHENVHSVLRQLAFNWYNSENRSKYLESIGHHMCSLVVGVSHAKPHKCEVQHA